MGHSHNVPLRRLKALVLRGKEGGLAVVTALNDVLGHARNA